MGLKILKHGLFQLALAALLGIIAQTAHAQCSIFCPPRAYNQCDPCATTNTTTIPSTTPTTPSTTPPSVVDPVDLSRMPVTTAARGGNEVANGPGYLDNAVPFSHFRLRYDSAYNNNRPDRAEYFYPKCGCFGPPAPGPRLPETSIDYQDVSAYFEWAPNNRFSVFAEAPLRMINPDVNSNTAGLGDINVGFKTVLFQDNCRILTFQGRLFIPTGDPDRGLGNDHVSLEPSLLYAQNLSERLTFFGQFGDWIPVGGTDFAGNILRYGAGLSYALVNNDRLNVAPVAELLGWSVLGGKEFIHPGDVLQNAGGDTIVNGKLGVRFGFGANSNSDFYIGYGRALTGEVWYQDIVRLEYRLKF